MKRDTPMRNIHHYIYVHIAIIAIQAAILTACNPRQDRLPKGGGAPYSVQLVGDTDSTLYGILTPNVPSLPQAEPSFDVSCTNNVNATKYARSIVIVNTDPRLYSHTSVKYEEDVFAHPQMIVYVNTPSTHQLHVDSCRLDIVRDMLLRHERNAAIAHLSKKHNPKIEKEVSKMFGINMFIPQDMTSYKKGQGFIWISNNSATAMCNICIYYSENRDSVMMHNIKGETDSMYMTTAKGSVVCTKTTTHGNYMTIRRGLWEMRGDAMGGPFVSHIITEKATGNKISAEAFVYAPGIRKRNLLLATEASLHTITPADNIHK